MHASMELDHVEAFLAIVRRGGFTRASASLHLSQPAISRRIGLLERELGAPVFERVRSGVILSDAGRAFLPHAEALLASLRDGIAAVEALRGASHGAISLAVVGTLASSTLTRCLRRFRRAHPGVDLRLRTALSAEVSALVRRGDVALGLRYVADPSPDIVSTIIHGEAMVAVCAANHHLARARRIDARALAGERWLSFPPHPRPTSDPYATALGRGFALLGLDAPEIVPIDSLTAQKRMAEAGFGLALVPASSVDEELRTGTLRRLRIPALRASIPIALIHRRRSFLSGAARALIAAITAWPARP
jgi:DNA-binding transcriptional LysR family regulator